MLSPIFGRPTHLALSMVLIATFGLSFKGIFAKFTFITGMDVPTFVLLRLSLALPLIWLVGWAVKRGKLLSMRRRDWRDALLVGLFFLGATVFDATAIHMIGASLSRMVLFSFPLIIVLMTAVWERRRPAGHQLAAFLLAYGGLAVLLLPAAGSAPPHFWEGVAWAFGAALSYACYLVLGTGVMRRVGSVSFTVVANTSATVVLIAWSAVSLDPAEMVVTEAGMGWMAAVVVFSTVMPFFLLYEGMRRLGPERASLISLGGPAVTVVLAWVLLGETMSPLQLGGFALVIAGLWVLERPRRQPAADPVVAAATADAAAGADGGLTRQRA